MTEPDFSSWVPAEYLAEYYQRLESDEHHAIRYFVEATRGITAERCLCFGCGPTLHHVFATAPHARKIFLSDYLPENLAELERFRQRDAGAHDWRPFIRYTLQCELGRDPSDTEVSEREELTRARLAGLLHGDASQADPLGAELRGSFDLVLSPFCADSITDDHGTWHDYCRNIASLVSPGGHFLTAALRACARYRVGPRWFPSANVDELDLCAALERDFRADSVEVRVAETPDLADSGYVSILLGRAEK